MADSPEISRLSGALSATNQHINQLERSLNETKQEVENLRRLISSLAGSQGVSAQSLMQAEWLGTMAVGSSQRRKK